MNGWLYAGAVPHFVVHLPMLGRLAPSTAAVLITTLGLAIILPAVLLAIALGIRR